MDEIKAVARRQLIDAGPRGIQLRAVAREVGLTAPALYRYFPSLEDLVDAVTVDLFDDLVDELEAARDSAPVDSPVERITETSRAFRRYAIVHPHEFQVMFGSPPGGLGVEFADACQAASSRFGNVFALQFIAVWHALQFPVPADEELAPGLAEAVDSYWTWLVADLAPGIPKGAVISFMEAWIRIYGTVALEVFGHLSWMMNDGSALFEQTLMEIGASWGLTKPVDC